MKTTEKSIKELRHELSLAHKTIEELTEGREKQEEVRKKLARKEAFNFALFNYNPALTVVVDRDGRVVKSNRAKLTSGDKLPRQGDIMYRDYAAGHSLDMYAELMGAIESGKMKRFEELRYKQKYLSITISPFPGGAIIVSNDITLQKQAEADRLVLIAELRRALEEVNTLRGLIPICAGCKKIRDDKGLWNHIEVYISEHSQADFSHTLCPDCIRTHYPAIWEKQQQRKSVS